MYVWKEYDVFKVFYENVHNRIKDKIKYFDEETQATLASQNAVLSEKVYQKNLRDYIRAIHELVKGRQFKTEGEERKYFHPPAAHGRLLEYRGGVPVLEERGHLQLP